MLPPPILSQRSSITNSLTAPLCSTSSPKANELETCRIGSYQNYNDMTHNDALITKCNFHDQVGDHQYLLYFTLVMINTYFTFIFLPI